MKQQVNCELTFLVIWKLQYFYLSDNVKITKYYRPVKASKIQSCVLKDKGGRIETQYPNQDHSVNDD